MLSLQICSIKFYCFSFLPTFSSLCFMFLNRSKHGFKRYVSVISAGLLLLPCGGGVARSHSWWVLFLLLNILTTSYSILLESYLGNFCMAEYYGGFLQRWSIVLLPSIWGTSNQESYSTILTFWRGWEFTDGNLGC